MPWYHTKSVLPPLNTEVVGYLNKSRKIYKFEHDFDLYNINGKPRQDLPEYWTYPDAADKLADPEFCRDVDIARVRLQEQHEVIKPIRFKTT